MSRRRSIDVHPRYKRRVGNDDACHRALGAGLDFGGHPSQLFTTAITSAEIFTGIARLPAGKRKSGLQASAEIVFQRSFAGRVLPFDEKASRAFASTTAARRAMGRPLDDFDGQIAAITIVAGFTLVTRNVSDFEHCGLTIVDPWL